MRTCETIIVLLTILFCLYLEAIGQHTRSSDGSPPLEQKIWTEEEAIYWLREAARIVESTGGGDRAVGDVFWAGKTLANLENPDRLILSIIDFPAEEDQVHAARIEVLIPYKSHPGVTDFVYSSALIEQQWAQKAAARAFLKWGDWENAYPLITKWEDFGIFWIVSRDTNNLRDKAIPFLMEYISKVGWEDQINASNGLLAYGDTTAIREVCANILRNSQLSDDESTVRAQSFALKYAEQFDLDLIVNFSRLVDSPNMIIRERAIEVLETFMLNCYDEARIAIEKIAEENQDPELRATAKEKLLRYEEGIK